MELLEKIKQLENEIILHRRYLHTHPELSGQEVNTLAYIGKQLEFLKIPYEVIDRGGILACIDSGMEGKTIMLRADIDALAIDEVKNDRNHSYCSLRNGVMHACGHDAHTSMLLMAAKVLMAKKNTFKGRVLLCFEQGEEAIFSLRYIMRHLEKQQTKIDTCFAMHVSPYIESGKIMLNEGPVMAGLGKFDIELKGQSGHGSRSDLAKNPIDCFTDIVNGLQKARLNLMDPFEVFSMSVCEVHGGSSLNIIPENLRFKGNYRYFNIDTGLKYQEIIKTVCDSAAMIKGIDVVYHELPYPSYPLINKSEPVRFCRDSLQALKEDIMIGQPWMGSETFAYYLLKYSGMFMFLGIKNESKGITSDIHNANFDVDEDVLYKGVYALVKYSLDFLNESPDFPFEPMRDSVERIFRLQGYEVND